MSAVIEKLEAQASQLLDGFIGLRETYALLDPMLFDRETIASRGSFGQRNGFLILRRSLLLACVQDIGRLCLERKGDSGIVYTLSRASAESTAEYLRGLGIDALPDVVDAKHFAAADEPSHHAGRPIVRNTKSVDVSRLAGRNGNLVGEGGVVAEERSTEGQSLVEGVNRFVREKEVEHHERLEVDCVHRHRTQP